MNILFISPSYKPANIYGGTIVVISLLAESLAELGHSVTVLTTTANGKEELDVTPGKPVLVDGVSVIYFKRITGDHTHVSPALWRYLNRHVKEFDVVHIHSWWNVLVIGAAMVCRLNKVVPVISPHGMFSTYILSTNNSLIKKITQKVAGVNLLKKSVVHVSTEMEWQESQLIVPGWKGAIIPNLVRLSENKYPRTQNDIFTIGFLSRVDPKKGLDLLIQACAKLNFPYKLVVAGSGDEAYLESLKSLSKRLGNDSHIEWVGWKNGEEKFEYLAGLDLFALTSHSENFAVVVIESLSVGTPVLLSDQVGLFNYVQKNDLGWVIPNDVDKIAEQLIALREEEEKIKRINNQAPAFIAKEFSPTELAARYADFYSGL